jgi:hypothetical protein
MPIAEIAASRPGIFAFMFCGNPGGLNPTQLVWSSNNHPGKSSRVNF